MQYAVIVFRNRQCAKPVTTPVVPGNGCAWSLVYVCVPGKLLISLHVRVKVFAEAVSITEMMRPTRKSKVKLFSISEDLSKHVVDVRAPRVPYKELPCGAVEAQLQDRRARLLAAGNML